jgi:hypothetical protein
MLRRARRRQRSLWGRYRRARCQQLRHRCRSSTAQSLFVGVPWLPRHVRLAAPVHVTAAQQSVRVLVGFLRSHWQRNGHTFLVTAALAAGGKPHSGRQLRQPRSSAGLPEGVCSLCWSRGPSRHTDRSRIDVAIWSCHLTRPDSLCPMHTLLTRSTRTFPSFPSLLGSAIQRSLTSPFHKPTSRHTIPDHPPLGLVLNTFSPL